MAWTVDHLPDLESDLSRFHRIDDMHALDGPKFFRLAWRVSTYGGVMAMRLQEQQRAAEPPAAPSSAAGRRPHRAAGRGSVKPLAAFMAQHPEMIERRKVT